MDLLRMPVRSYILIFLALAAVSCEKPVTHDIAGLGFSADTIFFDTVFTSVGSATRELVVKNYGRSDIEISRIFLAGGQASPFRLNIDGEATVSASDILLSGRDSMFIFVDVIIDPLNTTSPVLTLDSVIFEVDGRIRSVVLMAWGQDVILLDNSVIKTEVWISGKPYLIYGKVKVDTAEILTVEKGTRVYFHRNSSMYVAGSLKVTGTEEEPVVFASDRTEKIYEDIPGQWQGIFIAGISKGNSMSNAIVRNSTYGIRLGEPESAGLNGIPDLKLKNIRIIHSGVTGLAAYYANVEAENSVFSHCGFNCVSLSSGGDYRFYHCTFQNTWEYGLRLTPALLVDERPSGAGTPAGSINLLLFNSVVTGDLNTEIEVSSNSSVPSGSYFFDHCLVKMDTSKASVWKKDKFPGTDVNLNPRFIDAVAFDFRPDTLSPLADRGSNLLINTFPSDIRGYSRLTDGLPDIGAYERRPGEKRKLN
ncbi:MAG TPA: choice-of-anchor Q domain-containing protein [Bacteroidales bacterium]|nr:choice-of-anchor Q domain-containing protein [Bacteroidales bacterium]